MGASFAPQTTDPEFTNSPRREFNLWFDPEAAHKVLVAPWKRIVCTSVDISIKTHLTPEMLQSIRRGSSAAAQYIGKYGQVRGNFDYLWDELAAAAWLDPSVITKSETRFMDMDLDHGPNYGTVLTWGDQNKPNVDVRPVEIQVDVDTKKFYDLFVNLLTAPTPKPPMK
jgi:inosine-uridine nucleoside N-ribohydrolase